MLYTYNLYLAYGGLGSIWTATQTEVIEQKVII